jgi:hypothetical protein
MKNHFLIRAKGEVEEQHPLKTLLQKLPQNYSMQGRTNLFKDAKIFLKGETEEIDCGTLGSPKVLKLLEAATNSPFGKGAETVFDENVRKGKEIKAENINIPPPPPRKNDGYIWGYSDKVAGPVKEKSFTELLRDMILENTDGNFLGPNIDIQFYKLAIYEPGGHFQTHRDTVHSADHKATLLLEVRSDHKGGVLTLQKNDMITEWNLAEPLALPSEQEEVLQNSVDEFILDSSSEDEKGKSDKKSKINQKYFRADEDEYERIQYNRKPRKSIPQKNNKDSLSWMLFYTDIEHSVSPVTEGIRVVMQFDVYERPAGTFEETKAEEEYDDEGECIFATAMPIETDELITAKSSMITPIISILQKESTSKRALVIPLYYLYTSQSILPEKLKNIDKELFQSLLSAGFPLALTSVELVVTINDEGASQGRKKILIHDFPLQVYEKDPQAAKKMTKVPKGFEFTYVVSGLEATKLLEQREFAEHTGNESAEGKNRYLCGAMIVFKQRK